MKVIIAGGRDFKDFDAVKKAVADSGFAISEVVSGACRLKRSSHLTYASGADGLGERWADENGIPCKRFYPEDYGPWPACGPKRNAVMAGYADALILMPGGSGSASMLLEAGRRGLPIFTAGALLCP